MSGINAANSQMTYCLSSSILWLTCIHTSIKSNCDSYSKFRNQWDCARRTATWPFHDHLSETYLPKVNMPRSSTRPLGIHGSPHKLVTVSRGVQSYTLPKGNSENIQWEGSHSHGAQFNKFCLSTIHLNLQLAAHTLCFSPELTL